MRLGSDARRVERNWFEESEKGRSQLSEEGAEVVAEAGAADRPSVQEAMSPASSAQRRLAAAERSGVRAMGKQRSEVKMRVVYRCAIDGESDSLARRGCA